jgi:Uma2 family endonuclease
MSAITQKEVILSPAEYLAGELKSELRHEYLSGRVYGMAGASVNHNHIAGSFFGELYQHLRGKKCQPYMADMKVHIHDDGDDWFYYPDVMVNCDPSGQFQYYCDTPSLIVEVLSPDTEKTDRREKMAAYQRLPSLHTYILADQLKREVTVYHRVSDGWEKTVFTGDAVVTVPELEFFAPLDVLYARTGL